MPTHLGLRFAFSNLVSKLVSLSLPHSRRSLYPRLTAHPPSLPTLSCQRHPCGTSPRVGRSQPPVPHARHRSTSSALCTSGRAPTSLRRPSSSCSGCRQVQRPRSRSRSRLRRWISLWPIVAARTQSPPVAVPPYPHAPSPRTLPTCCIVVSHRAPSPPVNAPPCPSVSPPR